MLNAGDLKTRGVLMQRATSTDGQGGGTAWTPIATIWAGIAAVQGIEGFAADRQNPIVTYNITIRYRPGVTPSAYGADATMRFVVGARTFDIRSVVDTEEAHEELVLGCELYIP